MMFVCLELDYLCSSFRLDFEVNFIVYCDKNIIKSNNYGAAMLVSKWANWSVAHRSMRVVISFFLYSGNIKTNPGYLYQITVSFISDLSIWCEANDDFVSSHFFVVNRRMMMAFISWLFV